MNDKIYEEMEERAIETAKSVFPEDTQASASIVAGLMIGFHLKESKALEAELKQVSKDRYRASVEISRLKGDDDQLRAAVGFELDKLREVVEGIEGAL